jgi:hypothetical protein
MHCCSCSVVSEFGAGFVGTLLAPHQSTEMGMHFRKLRDDSITRDEAIALTKLGIGKHFVKMLTEIIDNAKRLRRRVLGA